MSEVRLIDANALLSQIPTIEDEYKFVRKLIENAPTVEYPFYAEAYQTGYEEGQNERPHAHWIIYPEMNEDRYCSKCDMDFENDGLTFNFCPHCGAQMDGGDEND